MPFIPAGATPAQLDQFAQRLNHHLSHLDARSGLMSVQNAFARAGGYPDRHAAEVSAKATRYFFNPLLAIGHAPATARHMPVLMGVKAHKLLEWGKHAWKKQRAMLSKPHFGIEDAQALLADAWSHPNWAAAMLHTQQASKQPIMPQMRLKTAATLEQLAAICAFRHGTNPNMSGLHTVLGENDSGQVIGLDVPQALTHLLAIDDYDARRHSTARRWIAQRVRAGDRVLLMDGSEKQTGARAAIEEAALCGRARPLMINMRETPIKVPHLEGLSASSLADLIMTSLFERETNVSPEDFGRILSWVSLVCLRVVHQRHGRVLAFVDLVDALGDPGQPHAVVRWSDEMQNACDTGIVYLICGRRLT